VRRSFTAPVWLGYKVEMEVTAMKLVPARDGRPIDTACTQPIGAVNGQYWACACCGSIVAAEPRSKLVGRLRLCSCGCLNELP